MATENKKFMYIESSQIPLKEIPYGDLKENIIDPTTNKPYRGIVLEGPFASLKEVPNNNKRIYDIPKYLELLQKLKQQILNQKGVYGELEHPEKYSVNFNNVSHKILDVWYIEEEQMVYGRVMLLNTPKGKIAQEIVRSGGLLAISGRAAGEEISQPDGTSKAITKLLTTYDLVYHPGFSSAVLGFKELNESQKFIQEKGESKSGFGIKIYQNQLKKLPNAYLSYIKLNESVDSDVQERRSKCFLEWLCENQNNLLESTDEEKEDQDKLEDNVNPDEKKKQKKLQIATKQELNESESKERTNRLKQRLFFQEAEQAQAKLRKNRKLDKAYYDDSSGFVTDNVSITGITPSI